LLCDDLLGDSGDKQAGEAAGQAAPRSREEGDLGVSYLFVRQGFVDGESFTGLPSYINALLSLV